jgi:F420-non-reducing hydrogenase iron-sulfur subunit
MGLKPFLKAVGINSERVRLEWIGASEALKLVETVKSFTQTVKGLGPSPLNRRQE